jgi:hypothetical protein
VWRRGFAVLLRSCRCPPGPPRPHGVTACAAQLCMAVCMDQRERTTLDGERQEAHVGREAQAVSRVARDAGWRRVWGRVVYQWTL